MEIRFCQSGDASSGMINVDDQGGQRLKGGGLFAITETRSHFPH